MSNLERVQHELHAIAVYLRQHRFGETASRLDELASILAGGAMTTDDRERLVESITSALALANCGRQIEELWRSDAEIALDAIKRAGLEIVRKAGRT